MGLLYKETICSPRERKQILSLKRVDPFEKELDMQTSKQEILNVVSLGRNGEKIYLVDPVPIGLLTLVMLNKLRCHAHF